MTQSTRSWNGSTDVEVRNFMVFLPVCGLKHIGLLHAMWQAAPAVSHLSVNEDAFNVKQACNTEIGNTDVSFKPVCLSLPIRTACLL
jgi:hypothetical protein